MFCFALIHFFFHSKYSRYLHFFFHSKYSPLLQSLRNYQKNLKNSHLIYFSVNLTDNFKVIDKYRRKAISKYCQKLLFIVKWEPTIMLIMFWDFLMFDQIFLSSKFSYVVRYFTWILEFTEGQYKGAEEIYTLRALFIYPLTCYIFLFTQKS